MSGGATVLWTDRWASFWDTGEVLWLTFRMLARSYFQMPAYAGEKYAGLLTSNTVARWLAVQLSEIDLAQEAHVGEVLER